MKFSLKKTENRFRIQTFYGAQNGWVNRGFRTEEDANRLVFWLNRIDSNRIHKKIEA